MAVRRSTVVFFANGLLAIASFSQSATLTVRRDGSGDFATIQPALDAAALGDTIDIGPGEYIESQTIRPPQWGWDLEIFAYVTVDNLTIVGAGADQTFIGPLTPQFDNSLFSPKSIYAGDVRTIGIRDLTIKNCYDGIYGSTESLTVRSIRTESNRSGIFVIGDLFLAEGCATTGVGSAPVGIHHAANCTNSIIRVTVRAIVDQHVRG